MVNEIDSIDEQFRDLYLNETDADVRIIIGDENLPAHRSILAQRCDYFSSLFASGMKEATTGEIVVQDTSIAAFKSFLKWIYTGDMTFTDIDHDIEVLRLMHMYNLTDLMEVVTDHLKATATVNSVCSLLRVALDLCLHELHKHIMDNFILKPNNLFAKETIITFTLDEIQFILLMAAHKISSDDLIESLVEWMKANIDKKEHFRLLLSIIPLNMIPVGELALIIPPELIDANLIFETARRHQVAWAEACGIPDNNIALLKYGVKVISGGDTSFFSKFRSESNSILKHTIGSSDEGIVVDLGQRFKLNSLKMHLKDTDARTYSYWISVSEDNLNWTRVIDHSKYACRSLQRLYFKERKVRYIRICGTAPANGTFEISRLEALYTTEPFEIDPETTLLIPFDNVALVEKNAIVIQGQSFHVEHAIINSKPLTIYNLHRGYTEHKIGDDGIIVQLPQPYLLKNMELFYPFDVDDDDPRSYHVEVSTDKKTWTRIFSDEEPTSWSSISFEMQIVVFIKITGTLNLCRFYFLACPQRKIPDPLEPGTFDILPGRTV